MKNKVIYYLIITALFIVCWMSMAFLLVWIEILFDINIPRIYIYAGFGLTFFVFDYLKSIVKRYLKKRYKWKL